MGKIIFVSGGQRSGKSLFAERLVLAESDCPVYVATAEVHDADFADRVRKHQERRGSSWTNIEETRQIGALGLAGRVVLVDCLTLWASNLFFDYEAEGIDKAWTQMQEELDRLLSKSQADLLVLVSNEIGLGGTSANRMQRKFADLLGWVNQYVASRSDEAYLIVSGLPLRLK
ncbi:cobinamide kinase [Porphyromonas crevioricanis]|uniref:Adenosylcobinamide kinase n=2 Tax=Porphyromonas crevioricanis TaxID=393921 RepID=A0A0A2FT31_9PORP|nr:bifunctional adenosylcobinamide kinase/adenosylcobinamide-phosphate guanylyltransferase [Porphyromonas crevioricanis]KGN89998.1 cobinamide kinase [Porphyromonas crevioricanis]KGN94178.1 cobinamide kinase [Porphyromonas crevioricanis]SJZ68020.1 adenosylcobinamide kinase /adenosylcobinamide-phosphate guanylyltransferase [Porphyromonas crevioricanis]SQH73995.1 Adenosylcobinamide kinase [Porphyromonas crevioricanis]GAD04605.1 adenosylcobinamide-phosphate guanylyltransferase [Porphyromonas crevi